VVNGRGRSAGVFILLVAGLLAGARADTIRELTILHVNDLHARLRPDADGFGGFAHLATALHRERLAAPASLTMHAGDLVQGTLMSTLFEGVPAFDLANHLGLDVACLGNHEFDYGWERIDAFARAARFPIIASNVVNASGERVVGPPYILREVGGLRVAIVAALLERMGPWGPWRAAPIIDTLRPIVAEAKARADVVIVLGHIERHEAELILRELPESAAVVAGHVHSGLEKEIEVDGRVAVNAQAFGRELGRLRLRYDTAAGRVVSHDWTRIAVDTGRFPADPVTERAIDAWEAKVSALVDLPIGRSSRPMSRDEVRTAIQDMLTARYGADVGYLSRIGIRDTIPEGNLLARHMWNVSPLDDRVVTIDIDGGQLLRLLDPAQPPATKAGLGTITSGRRYRVVTSDLIGQRWVDNDPDVRMTDEQVLLGDVLVDWVKGRGVIP
jgi:5'-nucleotidase/UDP-sugar diphosphatase